MENFNDLNLHNLIDNGLSCNEAKIIEPIKMLKSSYILKKGEKNKKFPIFNYKIGMNKKPLLLNFFPSLGTNLNNNDPRTPFMVIKVENCSWWNDEMSIILTDKNNREIACLSGRHTGMDIRLFSGNWFFFDYSNKKIYCHQTILPGSLSNTYKFESKTFTLYDIYDLSEINVSIDMSLNNDEKDRQITVNSYKLDNNLLII